MQSEEYAWAGPLEEFEPLEYEDKWGRKSPASYSIRFTSIFLIKFITI